MGGLLRHNLSIFSCCDIVFEHVDREIGPIIGDDVARDSKPMNYSGYELTAVSASVFVIGSACTRLVNLSMATRRYL